MVTDGAIVFGEHTITIDYTFNSDDLIYPFIAPFWDDIDLNRNGVVFYRISNSFLDLERITATVRQSTTTKKDFAASWCMVVTWYKVAQRGDHTLVSIILNFQKTTFNSRCML